jgi:hypothetical protein
LKEMSSSPFGDIGSIVNFGFGGAFPASSAANFAASAASIAATSTPAKAAPEIEDLSCDL